MRKASTEDDQAVWTTAGAFSDGLRLVFISREPTVALLANAIVEVFVNMFRQEDALELIRGWYPKAPSLRKRG